MRQIVLDTETTGLDPKAGHRVIEIGCVEIVNRRLTGNHFHRYLQPNREIDEGALQVHGISQEFLADKPEFKDVQDELISFIRDAELVIHNAPFDVGFLDAEFQHAAANTAIAQLCSVEDTLVMARKMHPGQRNSLDALCQRYQIDNTQRTLHGALLDAEILAEVYLHMTGGQTDLLLEEQADQSVHAQAVVNTIEWQGKLRVQKANSDELDAHNKMLDMMQKQGACLWKS